jgi:hypothetical protein
LAAPLSTVASFHWASYIASDEADRSTLVAVMALREMVFQLDPEGCHPSRGTSSPRPGWPCSPHVLWEAVAADIDQATAEQDASGADDAIFLHERALAGLGNGTTLVPPTTTAGTRTGRVPARHASRTPGR